MKHFFFPMLVLIAMLTACSNNPDPSTELQGIHINKNSIEIEVGQEQKLRVVYEPTEAKEGAPEVTWESDKTKVATVDDNGLVKGKSVGKAIITATCGKFTAECEVEVVPEPDPVPVDGITLNEASLELREGQGFSLHVIYDPEISERWADPIEWVSSEESVAIVDQNGYVQALHEGNTIITAKCGEALNATCYVKVVAAGIKLNPATLNFTTAGGQEQVQLMSNSAWTATYSESWLTVTPTDGGGNAEITITVQSRDENDRTTLTANIVFQNADQQAILTVVSHGFSQYFSVSETKKIEFAPGNLQYQASTKTWRFADKQYICIGEDNKNISSTYSGWIDLFGWGTGQNPTNYSTDDSQYSTFNDWGENKISNSSEAAGTWFTLSNDEWEYLIYTRNSAKNKRFSATVNNVHGCILLPDNCTLPTDIYFYTEYSWTTNNYNLDTWERMEKLGAVFLPACGYRDGQTIRLVSEQCLYWTSTKNHYLFYASSSGYTTTTSSEPRFGQGVRLAKVVE